MNNSIVFNQRKSVSVGTWHEQPVYHKPIQPLSLYRARR